MSFILNNLLEEHSLLKYYQTNDKVFDNYKFTSIESFIYNLILAISNDIDITIIDNDFSESELINLNISDKVNNEVNIVSKQRIENFDTLVLAVINSKSNITLFTSGTTGQPKSVQHNLNTLLKGIKISDKHSNDRWVLNYNPTHIAGIQVIFQAFLNKNFLVYTFNKPIDVFNSIVLENSITHISSTPTFYRMLPMNLKQMNSVKKVSSGGERMDSNLISKLSLAFPNAEFRNIYATTESGTLLTSKDDIFEVPDNLKDTIRVINSELQIFKYDYNNNEKLDWFSTGDLVEIIQDEPLKFKIIGRVNEMINVGGYKVNPMEVEAELMKLDNIEKVLVYGKSNSVLGKILVADVVLKNNLKLDKLEIFKKLSNSLQNYKIPRIINQVETINFSKTRTGKIQRT